MPEQNLEITAEPLDIVARKIEEHAKKSDEPVIAAAMLLGEARSRIEAGEVGSVTWFEWAPANIKLSKSRLYELQCVAGADNLEAELERLRRLTRKRAKRYRDKKAKPDHQIEEERRNLIVWAKKAPIDYVKRVLGMIGNQRGAALPFPIDERLDRDHLEAA